MSESPVWTSWAATPLRTNKSERIAVPWLNGAGMTSVVFETPRWRISIAEEPRESRFSTIVGYDRVIIPIGAVPLELSDPADATETGATGMTHLIEPLTTFRFPGEWAPTCRATHPTRALNVMTARGHVDMSVTIGAPIRAHIDTVRVYLEIDTETALLVPPGCPDLPTNFGLTATAVLTATE